MAPMDPKGHSQSQHPARIWPLNSRWGARGDPTRGQPGAQEPHPLQESVPSQPGCPNIPLESGRGSHTPTLCSQLQRCLSQKHSWSRIKARNSRPRGPGQGPCMTLDLGELPLSALHELQPLSSARLPQPSARSSPELVPKPAATVVGGGGVGGSLPRGWSLSSCRGGKLSST